MARVLFGISMGKDIRHLARHPDFGSLARKFGKMKEGVDRDRALRQSEAMQRAVEGKADLP